MIVSKLILLFGCNSSNSIISSNSVINNPKTVKFGYSKKKINNLLLEAVVEPDISVNNNGNGFIFWKNKGRKISKLKVSDSEINLPDNTDKSFTYINNEGNGLVLINSNIYNIDKSIYRDVSYLLVKDYNLSSEPILITKYKIEDKSKYSISSLDSNGNGEILIEHKNNQFKYFKVSDFKVDKDYIQTSDYEKIIPKFLFDNNGLNNMPQKIIKSFDSNNGYIVEPKDKTNNITLISANLEKAKYTFNIFVALTLDENTDVAFNNKGEGLVTFVSPSNDKPLFLFKLVDYKNNITGNDYYKLSIPAYYKIYESNKPSYYQIYKPRVFLTDSLGGIIIWYEVNSYNEINVYQSYITPDSSIFNENDFNNIF